MREQYWDSHINVALLRKSLKKIARLGRFDESRAEVVDRALDALEREMHG